ncbi:MAG: hypothetical protein CMG00_04800 [Candidatus Marinimicrobia bacterium]|nr:hypothetical protein [Candidatus Neomarinimicrobiota bacterium]|tara:strand:+ start:76 stop:465 length:390 start_codon:yes stop_codon:yes gene_type:complete
MNFIKKLIIKTSCGPLWAMYDNDCSFCSSVSDKFKKIDVFKKVQWVEKDFKGKFPEGYLNRIKSTIIVYDPLKDKGYYNSVAILKIMSCLPFGRFFLIFLRIPWMLKVFNFLYKIVSRNRNYICTNKKV